LAALRACALALFSGSRLLPSRGVVIR